MKCRNCPYGQEDFYRIMAWYNKIISKCGIPNDFYGDLQPNEAADELEQFVWCDKVGGRVFCFGHCSEWYEQNKNNRK